VIVRGPLPNVPEQAAQSAYDARVKQSANPRDPGEAAAPPAPRAHRGGLFALSLGAIGVVFGDIGTSPLYTLKECLRSIEERTQHVATHADVYGILSMLFWSLTMVVTVKYLAFIMRADHDGEGGIFALLGLAPDRFRPQSPSRFGWLPILVVIGAALLYGDGAITPAISVLSAVEGLQLARPSLAPYTVHITCVILIVLFAIQNRGTATIGKLFGPVMILWFGTIAVLGAIHIAERPSILFALSPTYAVQYFHVHGLRGATILGSVVLAVTGGEALYADMGHFGRTPIRLAWLFFVWPSLLLCYFGQAAMVMAHPEKVANLFFEMAPRSFTIPLVILSSAATVIASQALISGAYSLTRQAIQLGFLPRLAVRHTSRQTEGQIYLPQVNWLLAIACVLIVVSFGSSTRLAAAYGLAVTGTMGITSIVFAVIAVEALHWRRLPTYLLVALFLSFDLPFFFANLTKFSEGGWLPTLIAAVLTGLMVLWARGRRLVRDQVFHDAPALIPEMAAVRQRCATRFPGTAAVLTASPKMMPPSLTQLAERFHALPERIIALHVVLDAKTSVEHTRRQAQVVTLAENLYYVELRFGFMEIQDVPAALALALEKTKLGIEEKDVTYFVRRENIVAGPGGQMGAFVERIFSYLHRNSTPIDREFQLPPRRVIELGWQIDL
jgi:KUP system potassium uptake protein